MRANGPTWVQVAEIRFTDAMTPERRLEVFRSITMLPVGIGDKAKP